MQASNHVLLALLVSGGLAAAEAVNADSIVQPNGGAPRLATTGQHFPKDKAYVTGHHYPKGVGDKPLQTRAHRKAKSLYVPRKLPG